MHAGYLTRRFALLLPFALAACGGEPERVYEPLRYNDLPPIQLNVASITVQQRFFPAGVAPDVSGSDPAPPVDALKAMANDRLQAFGTANRAVFAILNAALTRVNDVITGAFAVSLTIQDDSGAQLGYAVARVDSRHVGPVGDLASVLYDMTRSMMTSMNVEFQYQIIQHLKPWLTTTAAPATAVQQAPLNGSGADQTGVSGAQAPGVSGAQAPGASGAQAPGASGAQAPGGSDGEPAMFPGSSTPGLPLGQAPGLMTPQPTYLTPPPSAGSMPGSPYPSPQR